MMKNKKHAKQIDPLPPHQILRVKGVMDLNGRLQGDDGYANECIEAGACTCTTPCHILLTIDVARLDLTDQLVLS
jgi:hypothetical protein